MKRNLLLSLLLGFFVLSSCTNQDSMPLDVSSSDTPIAETSAKLRSITPTQASLFAQEVYEAINDVGTPTAKEDGTCLLLAHQKKVELAEISSITPISKNGVNTLYIVNFGDDDGYMVISADKAKSWALLVYNETGHLDPATIDKESTFALWLDEQNELTYQRMTDPLVAIPDKNNDLWSAFDGELKDGEEITISFSTRSRGDVTDEDASLRGTHRGSWGLSDIGPHYAVRYSLWGQGKGYNADAKFPNALAGCPAVAIGMYCRAKHFPAKYDYFNMPDFLPESTTTSNAISRMFRDIADNIPNYIWGTRISGAKAHDILTGLHNIGFKQARMGSYSFNTAYDEIKNNYPVLLAGYSNHGGHIWIADGYWEQEWRITRKFLWWKIKSWTEYSDMLYMNWGWNGDGNGWVDQAEWSHYQNNRTMYYNIKQ